jgi:steroid delta-isomerase-like uncharacterized protein
MGAAQERNRVVVYRVYDEIWNRGNLYAVDELLAADFKDHTLPPNTPTGRDGYRQLITNLRAALPDLRVEVESILAEDDRVAVRLNAFGTQHGTFLNHPPTHKPIQFSSLTFFTLRDGHITDRFGISDVPAILQQIATAEQNNR